MAPALFTIHQSRWALHLLLGVLSAVAIASSAPSWVGGTRQIPYLGLGTDLAVCRSGQRFRELISRRRDHVLR
jgi:hypothetical protein